MNYKAILFDMGNVILDYSPEYILSFYSADMKVIQQLNQAIFSSPYWVKNDEGTITQKQLEAGVLSALPDDLHDLACDVLATWTEHKPQRRAMIPLVKELHEKGYQLYLCSNAATSFQDYKDDVIAFQYFDGFVVSSAIKQNKPDPGIFTYLLDTYHLEPQDCLFIDDVGANIQGAWRCGIAGYQYNGNVELLREFLCNIKVL